MAPITRKVDKKARITLFEDFADQLVIVERVGPEEIRVRKAVVRPRRITLDDILSSIPEGAEHHELVDFGSPQGNETW